MFSGDSKLDMSLRKGGGEQRSEFTTPTEPNHLIHSRAAFDHFTLLPAKESRQLFNLDGRVVESIDVKKKIADGEFRLERHSGTGLRGIPKKGGHGGKFTWEGRYSLLDQDESPIALERDDPNFDENAAPIKRKIKKKKKRQGNKPGDKCCDVRKSAPMIRSKSTTSLPSSASAI